MASANPSKDEPTSMKQTWIEHCKISNETHPPALLEAWVEHCKILNVPHPPGLADALEEMEDKLAQKYRGRCRHYSVPEVPAPEAYVADFRRGKARRLEVDKEKEKKRMAKFAKIKQNAELKAGVEVDKQFVPKGQVPGSENDVEVIKIQEYLVNGNGTENINKEVDHASAHEAKSDGDQDKVKQISEEDAESRA